MYYIVCIWNSAFLRKWIVKFIPIFLLLIVMQKYTDFLMCIQIDAFYFISIVLSQYICNVNNKIFEWKMVQHLSCIAEPAHHICFLCIASYHSTCKQNKIIFPNKYSLFWLLHQNHNLFLINTECSNTITAGTVHQRAAAAASLKRWSVELTEW